MTPLTPEEVRAELERLKRNPDKLDPEKLAEVNTETNDLLTMLLKAVAKALQKD